MSSGPRGPLFRTGIATHLIPRYFLEMFRHPTPDLPDDPESPSALEGFITLMQLVVVVMVLVWLGSLLVGYLPGPLDLLFHDR